MHSTPTPILVQAMRCLARDIDSPDGVANAAIDEAAQRLEHLHALLRQCAPHALAHVEYQRWTNKGLSESLERLAVQLRVELGQASG